MRKIRTDVYFTDEQRKKLSKVAKARGVGVATVLRWLVDRALGIEDKPVEIDLPVLDLTRPTKTQAAK
jgi:hypothetical protein